jgi:hypothetical protein
VPIVPVRNLGKYGVITDRDPYELPAEAWSFASNARFHTGKISRAPVFRSVTELADDARFVVSASQADGLDLLFVGFQDGTVQRFTSGSFVDFSPTGYAPAALDALWTTTMLANVLYVNREDRVPWKYGPSDTEFDELPNWDPTWRTRLLRTCGGALVALNVTKGATSYPTMVKTSSIPLSGDVPTSWDESDPATLATENILADMKSPIVDATRFGESLCIYGFNEAWMMTPDGSSAVFGYRPLPFQKGAINANCSIEINGQHFVFGRDDIWAHDGFAEKSICDERVRDFIFNGINLSYAAYCFVAHNPKLRELHFCYRSGDAHVAFLDDATGCNRQAVYNYGNDTWTFDDLPMAFHADLANLDVSLTYATITETYATVGGSYLDQDDGLKRVLVYVGDASTAYSLTKSLYAFDLFGPGSVVVFGVDADATRPMLLEKNGLDLDALGAELRGYKTINSIYPQARLLPDSEPLVFELGSADYFGQDPAYETTQTYDGEENYKLDFRSAGRYLAMRITYDGYDPVSFVGMDVDLDVLGDR